MRQKIDSMKWFVEQIISDRQTNNKAAFCEIDKLKIRGHMHERKVCIYKVYKEIKIYAYIKRKYIIHLL